MYVVSLFSEILPSCIIINGCGLYHEATKDLFMIDVVDRLVLQSSGTCAQWYIYCIWSCDCKTKFYFHGWVWYKLFYFRHSKVRFIYYMIWSWSLLSIYLYRENHVEIHRILNMYWWYSYRDSTERYQGKGHLVIMHVHFTELKYNIHGTIHVYL